MSMGWEKYIFAGAVMVMMLVVCLILLFVWSGIEKQLDNRRMRFIERFATGKGRQVVVETLCECLDILPEKIMDAKRTIEGE